MTCNCTGACRRPPYTCGGGVSLSMLPESRLERAAEALFAHLWPKLDRLDQKVTWETTDERVRDGLRKEARVVYDALSDPSS